MVPIASEPSADFSDQGVAIELDSFSGARGCGGGGGSGSGVRDGNRNSISNSNSNSSMDLILALPHLASFSDLFAY